jgi:hypothetical protein
MNDARLRIRVQRDLREQFLEVCRARDISAAQEPREYVRGYVVRHNSSAIGDRKSDGLKQLK